MCSLLGESTDQSAAAEPPQQRAGQAQRGLRPAAAAAATAAGGADANDPAGPHAGAEPGPGQREGHRGQQQ